MDETHQKIAYRCLPLIAANQAGWIVRCPANFTTIWSGRIDNYGIRLTYEPDSAHLSGTALSHFGSGVLTFVLPWLFRTTPGIGLLVRGMTNETKDNAVALDGVVETDWSPYTFTVNWRILRPEVPVPFKKGDAVCMLQSFPLDLLERFDCSFECTAPCRPICRRGSTTSRTSAPPLPSSRRKAVTELNAITLRAGTPMVPRPVFRPIRLEPVAPRRPPMLLRRRRNTA